MSGEVERNKFLLVRRVARVGGEKGKNCCGSGERDSSFLKRVFPGLRLGAPGCPPHKAKHAPFHGNTVLLASGADSTVARGSRVTGSPRGSFGAATLRISGTRYPDQETFFFFPFLGVLSLVINVSCLVCCRLPRYE